MICGVTHSGFGGREEKERELRKGISALARGSFIFLARRKKQKSRMPKTRQRWLTQVPAMIRLVSISVSNYVSIPKFHQGLEFIANDAIVSILNVVRALVALPPFLEAIGGDADKVGSAYLVEDRIIVIGRQRLGLQLEERCRDFATPGRPDRGRLRMSEGGGIERATSAPCQVGFIDRFISYQRDFLHGV